MKLITRFLYLSAAGIMLLTSCAKEQTESYDKFENQALEAWMTQNRRELLKNYQPEGGYYVEILAAGNPDAKPVNDTACWVKFDFSGRDLSGNIVLTRRANEARQLGTFTKYTHYVPFYRYCGTENTSLMEGTFLAMRNTLHLDPDYAAGKGVDPEFLLREGSRVRLYLPSRIVGNGVEGDGGYEGQFDLSAKRPLIVDMEICDTVKNPLEAEGSLVDAFCEANGGMVMFTKDGEDDSEKRPTDPEDAKHPYNRAERWVSACDTVAQLYVDVRYDPAKELAGDTWNYNFESCVIDDFESIFLGTLSRYGKGVLLWNLMLDDKGAPNRPGGCTTCYGAIEISSSDYKTLKYNSHYYDLAQCAKVIRPGAVRIGASGYTASGLTYLAFRNPDGSKAFVALNRSAGEQTVAVYENADRSFKYTIPAKSIASFRWGAGAEN